MSGRCARRYPIAMRDLPDSHKDSHPPPVRRHWYLVTSAGVVLSHNAGLQSSAGEGGEKAGVSKHWGRGHDDQDCLPVCLHAQPIVGGAPLQQRPHPLHRTWDQ